MFLNDLHRKADELARKGDLDSALDIYLELQTKFPDSPDLLTDLGVLYLHKNQRDKCLSYLSEAISKQPDYSYRYASRAFAYGHFKLFDEAILDYEEALKLDPEDAVTHNNLGLLLEQKGYHDEAKKKFEQADKLAKAEDHLLNVLDEIEDDNDESNTSDVSGQPILQKDETPNSKWDEFKQLFTNGKQRREFIRFIKNGFKLK